MKIMSYRYQHARGLFDERPDDFHSFGPSFKMTKTHFILVRVDHFFRHPRHWNIPAPSRHPAYISVRAPLHVMNVTIVGQKRGPLLEIGGDLEDAEFRRVHHNRVRLVHASFS